MCSLLPSLSYTLEKRLCGLENQEFEVTIRECRHIGTIGFKTVIAIKSGTIGIGRRQLCHISFFDNEPKQILSVITVLSTKKKQTEATFRNP